MFITLSSTDVKAHRLRAFPGWSLHLNAVLITDGPLGYMQTPRVAVVLPNGDRIQLDCSMAADAEHKIRDGLQGIMLSISGVLDVARPKEGIVTVEVSTVFDIAGDKMPVKQRQLGVLRVIGT